MMYGLWFCISVVFILLGLTKNMVSRPGLRDLPVASRLSLIVWTINAVVAFQGLIR